MIKKIFEVIKPEQVFPLILILLDIFILPRAVEYGAARDPLHLCG